MHPGWRKAQIVLPHPVLFALPQGYALQHVPPHAMAIGMPPPTMIAPQLSNQTNMAYGQTDRYTFGRVPVVPGDLDARSPPASQRSFPSLADAAATPLRSAPTSPTRPLTAPPTIAADGVPPTAAELRAFEARQPSTAWQTQGSHHLKLIQMLHERCASVYLFLSCVSEVVSPVTCYE